MSLAEQKPIFLKGAQRIPWARDLKGGPLARYSGSLVCGKVAVREIHGTLPRSGYFHDPAATSRFHESGCWTHLRGKFQHLFEAPQSPIAKEALERICSVEFLQRCRLLLEPKGFDGACANEILPRIDRR